MCECECICAGGKQKQVDTGTLSLLIGLKWTHWDTGNKVDSSTVHMCVTVNRDQIDSPTGPDCIGGLACPLLWRDRQKASEGDYD